MAGAKETPRQKMIGMMYLVLTALLALNVSVDILDAFANLNDGMEISNVSISKKIAEYYSEFKEVCDKKGGSAAEYWGYFHHEKQGKMRFFVTHRKQCFLIRLKDGEKYVISSAKREEIDRFISENTKVRK